MKQERKTLHLATTPTTTPAAFGVHPPTTPAAFGVHPSNHPALRAPLQGRGIGGEWGHSLPGTAVIPLLWRGVRQSLTGWSRPATFLAASLLATPLLPLVMPGQAVAADIIISGPVTSSVYGNSSAADGSLHDLPANSNTLTIASGATVNSAFGGCDSPFGCVPNVVMGGRNSTASNNTLTILGAGTVTNDSYGGYAQTSIGDAVASGNKLIIASGGTSGTATGGSAETSNSGNATASDNSITMNGGTIGTALGGNAFIANSGSSDGATASGNTVTISGGTVSGVCGGSVSVLYGNGNGTASNNTVTISGGTITGGVIGGSVNYESANGNATASGNTITISGGTISGDITGVDLFLLGNVNTTITNNTITIEGTNTLDLSQSSIYGEKGGAITGNTFNLKRSGVTIAGLYNFENLDFYLPTNLAGGGTMLTVTNEANIDKANVNVGINGANTLLQPGDKVYLIDARTLTGTPANNGATVNGSGMSGVTVIYDFKVYTSGNQLIAEIPKEAPPPPPPPTPKEEPPPPPTPKEEPPSPPPAPAVSGPSTPAAPPPLAPAAPPPVRANPQAKALNESRVAGVTTASQGLDLTTTKGIDEAVKAAGGAGIGGIIGVQQSGSGPRPFGAIGGGTMSYDTGSSVDVDSISVIAGMSKATESETLGRLTTGAFLEYGHGGYDTYNSFPNMASVHGNGNIDNFGGGLLGRLDLKQFGQGIAAGRFYADGSLRLGQVRSDFDSDLRDMMGTAASFDTDSVYFGGHLGGGYLMAVTDRSQADFYARLLWTHQDGDDVKLSTGETVNFDAVDSLRTLLGARYTWVAKSWLVPYAGAGWEHEFDGEAGSTVNGIALDKPSLSGDTGMGELGVNMGSNTGKWAFDVGAQGYVGAREGVSGTVRVVYRW